MEKAKAKKAASIFRRVLAEIKPSKEETTRLIENVNMLTNRLKGIVGNNVEIRVAGSIARNTNLKGTADIDIFLLFSSDVKRDELVRRGLSYGKTLIKKNEGDRYEIRYAEHPYIRVYITSVGIKADIVPAYRIDSAEELATSVDRTPLHTEFINTSLDETQRDEVRLLKYFLKAHGIYGAEVKTGGFSGYLCELLIYAYGSFLRLLESFSECRLPLILDPMRKETLENATLINTFKSQFIVIDPVDQKRNVSAGVSIESLSRFVLVARRFVQKPDISLFYGKGFSSDESPILLKRFIEESGLDTFLIATKVPDLSVDTVWPQLRKLSEMACTYAARFGFEAYLAVPWVEGKEGLILLAFPRKKLKARMFKGPDVFLRSASSNFLSSHAKALGILVSGSTLYAIDRNRYSSPGDVIAEIVSGKAVHPRKGVSLKGATVYTNRIPKKYSNSAYSELIKRINV